MCSSSTVLPEPDAPTIATISPCRITRSTPRRTWLSPKDLCRSSTRISTGAAFAVIARNDRRGSRRALDHDERQVVELGRAGGELDHRAIDGVDDLAGRKVRRPGHDLGKALQPELLVGRVAPFKDAVGEQDDKVAALHRERARRTVVLVGVDRERKAV